MHTPSLVATLFLQNIARGGVTLHIIIHIIMNMDQNGIHIVYARCSYPYNNFTLIAIFCRQIEISL